MPNCRFDCLTEFFDAPAAAATAPPAMSLSDASLEQEQELDVLRSIFPGELHVTFAGGCRIVTIVARSFAVDAALDESKASTWAPDRRGPGQVAPWRNKNLDWLGPGQVVPWTRGAPDR